MIWGFALILLLLTWLAIGYKINTEHSAEIANIHRTNLNLTRTLEEHTLRTLKSVDQSVLFLKFQYEKTGGKGIDIHDYVREGMIISNLFNQLGVIDENGMYTLSNLPNHKVIDLSDREHFRVHQASDCNCLFVSKPVLGRASGKWSLQLTRRINKPDGSFGGVVVVSLDPFYFTNLYSEMDLGANSVITLVGSDGIVRARRTGDQASVGQNLAGSQFFATTQGSVEGTWSAVSSIDQVPRFYAFRQISGLPLTVFVGVDQREALQAFHQRTKSYWVFGAVFSLIIVAFAITSHQLLRKLEISRAKAEEANRLKSEFLASMSHELRTPLNGIIGYAEFLRDELSEEHQKEFASVILSSGTTLLNLLNSILDLAKIEANKLELCTGPTNVRQLARQVQLTHVPQAQEKGLSCTLEVAEDVPQILVCDEVRLTQVLNNLMHNAVKFTQQGEVSLRLTSTDHEVQFSVKDTGPGLTAEQQLVIFEKFRQLEHFEHRHHSGSGLGLALSEQLVAQMGGRLQVRSSAGVGSEFFFSIPVQSAST